MDGQVLLVTDGSPAAQCAGEMAIRYAADRRCGLRALYILDASWRSILGDEWISPGAVRDDFYRWLEGGLVKQAREVLERVGMRAEQAGVRPVTIEITAGDTERVIAEHARSPSVLLLVLPHPGATAPRAEAGLKYNLQTLVKKISCPLLVGPRQAP